MKIIGLSLIFLISSKIHASDAEYCEEKVSKGVQVCWVERGQLKNVSQLASAPYITELNWLPDSSSKISVICANSFSSLKHLQELYLNGHGIIYIQPNAFNGLTELILLELNNNNIPTESHMFAGLPKLRLLHLGRSFHHDVTKLPVGFFDNLPQLTELFLERNNFEQIPMGVFENLKSLKDLSLSFNNISTIMPGAFGRLSLDFLDIGFNKIKIIRTDTFNGLYAGRLHLIANSIETIEPRAFNGLNTECLDLSNNRLTTIGPNDFYGLSAIKLLLYSNNHTLTIAQGAFSNASLRELFHEDTPFQRGMNVTFLGLPESTRLFFIDNRKFLIKPE